MIRAARMSQDGLSTMVAHTSNLTRQTPNQSSQPTSHSSLRSSCAAAAMSFSSVSVVSVTRCACSFALANRWVGRPCGLYGNVPELRGGRLVSGRREQRRRSVQVMVQRRLLVEGLSGPAYTRRAKVVWDMRKSSALKHGKFPDTQC